MSISVMYCACRTTVVVLITPIQSSAATGFFRLQDGATSIHNGGTGTLPTSAPAQQVRISFCACIKQSQPCPHLLVFRFAYRLVVFSRFARKRATAGVTRVYWANRRAHRWAPGHSVGARASTEAGVSTGGAPLPRAYTPPPCP